MTRKSFPARTADRQPARFSRREIGLGPLLATLLAAAGCGEQAYPVTLSFTLAEDGPLTSGFVTVQHTSDPTSLGGGPIEADGTCRPLMRGRSAAGLSAGTYHVGVTGASTSDFDAPSPSLPFDATYMKPDESGLTFTVGPGNPERHEFSLKRPAKSMPRP